MIEALWTKQACSYQVKEIQAYMAQWPYLSHLPLQFLTREDGSPARRAWKTVEPGQHLTPSNYTQTPIEIT